VKFVTLFPPAEDIHLKKDVGMIPYMMSKYYGYESYLVSYKNGDYPHINEMTGLNLRFIPRVTGNETVDSMLYIIRNAKKIDILHTFHTRRTPLLALYKFLNKNGISYLKLDADFRSIKKLHDKSKKRIDAEFFFFKTFLKFVDVVSAESEEIAQKFSKIMGIEVLRLPNGFYDWTEVKKINALEKQNIILTVGRLGTEQKATEDLVDAFVAARKLIPTWVLHLVGPCEKWFEQYVDKLMKEFPDLKDRIVLKGPINDIAALNEEYKKAKVFCLPSRWESFGIVNVEALSLGCYLLLSDQIPPAREFTNNGEFGAVFPSDNKEALAELLIKVCASLENEKSIFSKIQEYAFEKFCWPKICKTLNDQILKLKQER